MPQSTYLGCVAFLIYTGLRLLLLVAVIGLFHALGMRGMLLLVAGFVVSGVLSYVLLSRPRNAMAQKVGGFFTRMNSRIDASSMAEDEDTDTASPVTAADASDESQTTESEDVVVMPSDSTTDSEPSKSGSTS